MKKQDVIFLRINNSFKPYENNNNNYNLLLYESTNFAWEISVQKVEDNSIKYAFTIYENKIKEIYEITIPINTEKENLIKCRIGQGEFRNKLIKYWQGCSVTDFDQYDILIASHIKPWNKSNNQERLDVFNGLLLLPTLDKLFDKGYISFDDNGYILTSQLLNNNTLLGINKEMKINIQTEHKKYLKFHREFILQQ